MRVEHKGWTQEHGSFRYFIEIDENKTDYELHLKNGCIAKQDGPFHEATHDWNCDGDVYTQFGAVFQYYDKNGKTDGRCFWTPENLVRALIDAKEKPDSYLSGNDIVAIPGIEVPSRDKRPNLQDTLRASERRRMMQDIERNRKMAALGIRHPGEPWAR